MYLESLARKHNKGGRFHNYDDEEDEDDDM